MTYKELYSRFYIKDQITFTYNVFERWNHFLSA